MSETSQVKSTMRGGRVVIFISIAILLVGGLGYLGGYFILPRSVQSAYQNKNCESVLSRQKLYQAAYPFASLSAALKNQIMECAVYTLAVTDEQNGDRQAAYEAYHIYADTYPQGIFIAQVNQHGGSLVIELARDELSQKQYAEAVTSLNLVLAQYPQTDTATEGQKLFGELYQAWGADLRTAHDFPGAEKVFMDFQQWAQAAQQSDQIAASQQELAQTYLGWGLALQARKQFEDALAKFDLAVATDPQPASTSSPSAQVKANQIKFYSEWGDVLVSQKDFSGAMEKYEMAATFSANDGLNASEDIRAHGYIEWATGLSADQDFLGGLILLNIAEQNAAADSLKTQVEQARSDLYLAFSQSSGGQAQQAITDALQIVCEHHTRPRLPIFGLNQDQHRVGIYGAEGQLSEVLVATTPGALYAVACVTDTTKVMGTAVHRIGTFFFDPSLPFGYVPVKYERIQHLWDVSLRKMDTAEEITTTQIAGGDPPPLPTELPDIYRAARKPQLFGSEPAFEDLVTWLMTALK